MYQTAATIQVAEQLGTDFVLPTKSHAGHYGDISPDFSGFSYPFKFQDVNLPNKSNQPTFGYTPTKFEDNTELHGFYQAHQYFDDIRDKLINKYFKFSDEVIEKASKYKIPENALAFSVRRGDYLQLQQNHCVLSINYYRCSVLNFLDIENIDQYFVFSDDINWCKTAFGDDCTYIEGGPFVQLYLMTQMKNIVLSNSTFAWWGAYLNNKCGKIIIPDPWFGPANDHHDTRGLYCPNWIKQKHERVLV
jgi:hypothetical protein